jgi:hypothetical protein
MSNVLLELALVDSEENPGGKKVKMVKKTTEIENSIIHISLEQAIETKAIHLAIVAEQDAIIKLIEDGN